MQNAVVEDSGSWRMDSGLFLLSTAVLTLEVLQTKIFAYSLDPLTIYFAIGVCLLGLGASATVLALLSPLADAQVRVVGMAFAAAGALAVPVAHAAFARLAHWLFLGGVRAAVLLVVLAAPYFCFGLTIALILVARCRAIGRAYAFNLGGSGLGCLAVFPLLDGFGAERALLLVGGLALGAALLLHLPDRAAGRGLLSAIALLLLAAAPASSALFPFPPDPEGQTHAVLTRMAELPQRFPDATITLTSQFSRWGQTGRVDVWELETNFPQLESRVGGPLRTLLFQQDASAGSILFGVEDDIDRAKQLFTRTVYGAGYVLGGVRDVLIIGLGGSPDILTAQYHGATRIVGVDINRTTIDLVRRAFRDFLGDPAGKPGVELHPLDGRTFLRTTRESYDLIQMSGVDTKTLLATGSLSLSENYLYTQEAMDDLLGHLRPDGTLTITLFSVPLVHRLVSMGLAGLRDLGISNPERHIVAVEQGTWRSVMIKRSPFDAAQLQRVQEWVAGDAPDIMIPTYEILGFSLHHPLRISYSPEPRPIATTPYFSALLAGRQAEFVASEKFDLSPPRDDRPFFFMLIRPADVFEAPIFRRLAGLALRLIAVSSVFVLLPLLAFRRRGLRAPRAGRTLLYFACLGCGFMLVEVGLIHRFVLLLGHQSHAISVVLFGILLGGGMGSLLSARLTSPKALSLALLSLVLLILAYAVGLEPAFDAVGDARFGMRLAAAFVFLLPLGVLLGIPFPIGLRFLGASQRSLLAWAIGVNGFASVVGATLGIPFSMFAGLRALMLLGSLLYVVALLTAPPPAVE